MSGQNMRTRLGISYGTGGIHLGGTSTTGSTEADICWSCHGADADMNEWGYNSYTSSGSSITQPTLAIQFVDNLGTTGTSFNYGWLYTSGAFSAMTGDWTNNDSGGAFRRDGYQHDPTRLSRQIFSVHSANVAETTDSRARVSSVAKVPSGGTVTRGTGANLEKKSEIRCSYCHDVHNLNRAVNPFGAGNDNASGRPFLRGSWMGNPYPPDMPPLSGYSYPTGTGSGASGPTNWGNRFVSYQGTGAGATPFTAATPRLYAYVPGGGATGTEARKMKGGFFIDNNSGNPNVGRNSQSTYGICALCHGTDINGMDYYTNSSLELWLGGNGHSNSVLGGTGSVKRELFDADRNASGGGILGQQMEQQDGVNVNQWGKPLNNGDAPWFSLYGGPQPCDGNGADCPQRNSGWYGGTAGSTTRGGNYASWYGGTTPMTNAHLFTCSKCHSPHATQLPALLVTNCLDKAFSNWSANSGDVGPNAPGIYQNPPNNCHRKTSTSTGWNRLAPGQ
jgi:cytochrome c553